jgi:hypothetical protein
MNNDRTLNIEPCTLSISRSAGQRRLGRGTRAVKRRREKWHRKIAGLDKPTNFASASNLGTTTMTHSKLLQRPVASCILLLCAITAQAVHSEESGSRRPSIAGPAEEQANAQAAPAKDLDDELQKIGAQFWIQIALLGGGLLVSLVGGFWYKAARVARHFGKDLNEDRAGLVLLVGLGIMGLGFAMYCLPK